MKTTQWARYLDGIAEAGHRDGLMLLHGCQVSLMGRMAEIFERDGEQTHGRRAEAMAAYRRGFVSGYETGEAA